MSALGNLVGERCEVSLKGVVAVAVVEIHTGVAHKVALGDADLLATNLHQQGQEHKSLGVHLTHRLCEVDILERAVVLLLDGVARTLAVELNV